MDLDHTGIAGHVVPRPIANSEPAGHIIARPYVTGPKTPVVYQAVDITRSTLRYLWNQLFAGHPLQIRARNPGIDDPTPQDGDHSDGGDAAVLVLNTPKATAPLALSGSLHCLRSEELAMTVDPPPLSWRLAAVELAHHLPCSEANNRRPPSTAPVEIDDSSARDRRLTMRPDIPCPSSTIAPTSELQKVVTALRAQFPTVTQLSRETASSVDEIAGFLAALQAAEFVVDAPRALQNWTTPFSFLGLHWSAHDPAIRRRYRQLADRVHDADDIAGVSARQLLDRAFDMLCDSPSRRRIRRQLVCPTPIAEVADFFRARLEGPPSRNNLDDTIDAARRVTELDGADEGARSTLTELLCRKNAARHQ